jgi:hypothetical protein
MKPVAIAALAFAAAFAGVFGFQYLPPLPEAGGAAPAYVPPPIAKPVTTTICDNGATVETVKQLALKKLKTLNYGMNTYILGGAISGNIELVVTGFRDRGKIGQGTVCAAQISMRAGPHTAEMSTEYSVEPTTDGKVMVSARFMPN